jgi:hypothetical protein
MKNETDQLEALQDIRRMMKESSRFLSLSGLSGILAGVYALGGAYLAHQTIQDSGAVYSADSGQVSEDVILKVVTIGIVVLVLSFTTALTLSYSKARKNNHRLFDHTSKKLMWSMSIPLIAGGLFCFGLIHHGGDQVLFLSPAMLMFYGLALTSSSRFTIYDVKYLGYLQLALGAVAGFYPKYGLLLWAFGFGVLHIIYGGIMWYKYDRNQ